MTSLPEAAGFTGSSITEAQQKTWIMNLRAYLAGLLGTTGAPADALDALGAIQAGEDGKIPASLMPADSYIDGSAFMGISDFALLEVAAADTNSVLAAFGRQVGYDATVSTAYVTAYTLTVPNLTGSIRFSCSHYISGTGTASLQLYKNGGLINTWTTTSYLSTTRSADVTVAPGDVIEWRHKTSAAAATATAAIGDAKADKGFIIATAYKVVE